MVYTTNERLGLRISQLKKGRKHEDVHDKHMSFKEKISALRVDTRD
jgi:hypothetical protein